MSGRSGWRARVSMVHPSRGDTLMYEYGFERVLLDRVQPLIAAPVATGSTATGRSSSASPARP